MSLKHVKKLLVVDDDDAFREAMELEFSDRGYQVLCAAAHRSALPSKRQISFLCRHELRVVQSSITDR